MKEVKAYLGNQLGFSETGRYILYHLILPKIQEIGIIVNEPFKEGGKLIDGNNALERWFEVIKNWYDSLSK